MSPLQIIGSNLRAVMAATLLSKADQQMRESIARLNAVSDSIIAEVREAREVATDDLAEHR